MNIRRRAAPAPAHCAYDDYIFDDDSWAEEDHQLDPPAHVSVEECCNFVERGSAYLVRGVAKRAIHVAIAMPYLRDATISELQLAYKAACMAQRLGWRRVVVALDDYFNEDARLFNVHQYTVENLTKGHQGKYLHQIKRERAL